jgi:hypothetical protein
VKPVDFTLIPLKHGKFKITGPIEKGKIFEERIELIDYTFGTISGNIDTKSEYEKYKRGEDSLIEKATEHYRKYKPIPLVKWYSQTKDQSK